MREKNLSSAATGCRVAVSADEIKLPGEVLMGSAIRLGRIAGIPVQIDFSFLLALPLLAYLFAQQFVAAARLVGIPQENIGGDRYLLLVKRLGVLRATRTASRVGKAFALIFAALGAVSGNLILILIAWFVYVGAQQETAQVEAKEALESVRVADLIQPDGPAIDARTTLADAAEQLLRARRLALPVLADGSFAGMLSADDIGRVRPAERARSLSADSVHRVRPLRPDSSVWEALQALSLARIPELAVVSPEGALLGTVSRADIERALRLAELQRSTAEGRATLRKRIA